MKKNLLVSTDFTIRFIDSAEYSLGLTLVQLSQIANIISGLVVF